ncbi:hypothetical protein GQ53DRAFT_882058 [Thozetella sp. PMI_491]|nr:hypothetical protein GQ53DRAFT_882058 [Thozetella sp. PMI_491]
MRVTLATSAVLFGLALANPVARRQELDYDAYESANAVASTVAPPIGDAAPQETASYNPAAVESAVVANIISAPPSDATDAPAAVVGKRAATSCTTRTINGPKVTQPADTPEAFLAYQPFTDAAMNAAVPAGYEATEGFVNIQATAQNKNYLTYTSKITAYDPAQCAAVCDGMAGCNAFVIYNERVPLLVSTLTQVPDANVCPGTATSSSGTLIKCAFYGQPVTTDQATNAYQFQGKFKVVWTGANAYSKVVPPLAGWRGPVSFNGKAIDAPAPAKAGFLRSQTFGANVPFDPSQCATGCVTLTAANAQSGNFSGAACMFFDAFIMYKNGLNGVFTCNYYSIEYDATFATNSGSTDANGNKFTVDHSYGYYVDLDLQSTCSSIFVSTTTILP